MSEEVGTDDILSICSPAAASPRVSLRRPSPTSYRTVPAGIFAPARPQIIIWLCVAENAREGDRQTRCKA